jgi:formate/nitrite transporter FocA (FNT family)
MSERGAKSSIIEALLCAWIVAAQVWYLLQFRPLLAFFAAKLFHHS